jgi:hypothetical protein
LKRAGRIGLLALLSTLFAPASANAISWIDRSHAIFLPPAMAEKLGATQTFPLFWWNFLVIEGAAGHPERFNPLCEALRVNPASPVGKISCGADLGAFLPLLRDWSRDYPLRHSFPGRSELKRKFAETYAQATLPMGGELLGVFREDPFSSYAELRATLETQVKMDLPNEAGVFVDPVSGRVVIPVQFNTPPTDTAATARFYEILGRAYGTCAACTPSTLIGPHASTYANEHQVQSDVEHVTLFGFFLTAAQILFLLVTRRARALWLFPPVLVATSVATAATVAVYGSIHGLTLAFGTGLIGLAIDYGLHSAFNVSFRGVWRANFVGILTTVAGFGVMLFSQVPLLRQLMLFAIVGLVVTYLLFFFLHYRYGRFFAIEPFRFEPRVSRARTVAILVILAAAVPGALLLRPNLDISQFDFQGPRELEVRNWLYPHLGVKTSLLEIDPTPMLGIALVTAHEKQKWADANGIGLQSIARFMSEPAARTNHLKSWSDAFCLNGTPAAAPLSFLKETDRKFFAPAIARLDCETIRGLGSDVPSYIQDFHGDPKRTHGFLSVWLPKTDAETAKVKALYPDALSLREAVEIFPKTLSGELRWMAPLSILLASFLLFLYYRRLDLTLLALVPFFCAAGVYSIGVFAFGLSFSFISLIALLMIFGFSIDYGVFAVDVTLQPEGRSVTGVWTCLLFASVATGLGFVPMLACKHPVLAHLSQTLTLGTIGTAIGTLWGIPGMMQAFKIRRLR